MVVNVLKSRKQAALKELATLIKDNKAAPINYNHYYTDNVYKNRGKRIESQIKKHIPETNADEVIKCNRGDHYNHADVKDTLESAVSRWGASVSADMEEFSCEESLDCLDAIYKVTSYDQASTNSFLSRH